MRRGRLIAVPALIVPLASFHGQEPDAQAVGVRLGRTARRAVQREPFGTAVEYQAAQVADRRGYVDLFQLRAARERLPPYGDRALGQLHTRHAGAGECADFDVLRVGRQVQREVVGQRDQVCCEAYILCCDFI